MKQGRLQSTLSALGTMIFLLLLLPRPVHAYIDPGSGSLIWQLLIAGGLTAAYLVKRHWRRITRHFNPRSDLEGKDDRVEDNE